MKPYLLPILFLGVLTPFTPWLDLHLESLFYDPEGGGHFVDNLFTHLLFRYGELLGFLAGGMACAAYLLSWVLPKWRAWRQGALTLTLTLILGAGIITNALFKEFWGRPRPKQVIEFGGTHPFRPYYQPDFHTRDDPQKSFPSGHAAMGFYYLAHVRLGRRYQMPLLYWGGMVLTLFIGGGLMLARMMMGGHFFSDTLFSALVMWLTTLGVERLLFKDPTPQQTELLR